MRISARADGNDEKRHQAATAKIRARLARLARRQREYLLGFAHTPQGVAAERCQPIVATIGRRGELGRRQHRLVQGLAQGFDPHDFIDGRTDDGEIKPIGRADIRTADRRRAAPDRRLRQEASMCFGSR